MLSEMQYLEPYSTKRRCPLGLGHKHTSGRRSKSTTWLQNNTMGGIDSCSRCCIGLSIPGVVFLTIIGYLFDKQPLYTAFEVEDASAASSNCYIGAAMYVGMIGLSFLGIFYEKKKWSNVSGQELHGEEGAGLLAPDSDSYGTWGHALSPMPQMPRNS
ncbi:unnamed protein product [Discosporangium mesarthrocarpum]